MAYQALTIEGGLFPGDVLDEVVEGKLPDQSAENFGVRGSLSDEMQAAFSDIRSYWESFQHRLRRSRESVTTLTREQWVVPTLEALGYTHLTLQRSGVPVGGESYVFSHRAGVTPEDPPVHAIGLGEAIDRRGATSRRSPHTTVQEYLNRSDALWGLVTNGENLRLLRDSQKLLKPTYLEVNLKAQVEDNLYSEFVPVFRLLHRSRLPRGADPADCPLEQLYQYGLDQGGRVREHLRDGVEEALRELGTALLRHPASDRLREALTSGRLTDIAYYRQLLRLVYRLFFLMVVEKRRLVFPPDAAGDGRHSIYTKYYSVAHQGGAMVISATTLGSPAVPMICKMGVISSGVDDPTAPSE